MGFDVTKLDTFDITKRASFLFLNKFDILKDLLKEMYKNKVDAKITLKGLITLMDEVDAIYTKKMEEDREEMKKLPKVEINKGE